MTPGDGARRKGKEKGLGRFCDIAGGEIRNWDHLGFQAEGRRNGSSVGCFSERIMHTHSLEVGVSETVLYKENELHGFSSTLGKWERPASALAQVLRNAGLDASPRETEAVWGGGSRIPQVTAGPAAGTCR